MKDLLNFEIQIILSSLYQQAEDGHFKEEEQQTEFDNLVQNFEQELKDRGIKYKDPITDDTFDFH